MKLQRSELVELGIMIIVWQSTLFRDMIDHWKAQIHLKVKLEKSARGVEYKIEVNCRRELVNEAIKVIKSVHPYEEALINIFPLANHLFKK